MARVVFWGVVAATLAVYAVMVLWSLPKVAAAAGGLAPFDLRPLGYSEAEARAFLSAITAEGRAFYIRVQHGLDVAYPALLALTLTLSFGRLVRSGGLRLVLILVAMGAMAADYTENALVAAMLSQPPEAVPATLIAQASLATLVKGLLSTVALVALLVAGIARLRRRRA